MKARMRGAALAAAAAALLAGCGGDMVDKLMANGEVRQKVVERFTTDPNLATQLLDRVMENDSLRTEAVDRLLARREVRELVMSRIAADPKMVDELLATAVRDERMKEHVLTLVRGMQMASPP